jgi:hypothetical protein
VLRRESVARDTLESPKTKMTVGGDVDDAKSQRLQQSSCVERVTGIEPALSAWEEFLSHRVSASCNDIGGLSQPLMTPTGLGLWPVCGPLLAVRALRPARWPRLFGLGAT